MCQIYCQFIYIDNLSISGFWKANRMTVLLSRREKCPLSSGEKAGGLQFRLVLTRHFDAPRKQEYGEESRMSAALPSPPRREPENDGCPLWTCGPQNLKLSGGVSSSIFGCWPPMLPISTCDQSFARRLSPFSQRLPKKPRQKHNARDFAEGSPNLHKG